MERQVVAQLCCNVAESLRDLTTICSSVSGTAGVDGFNAGQRLRFRGGEVTVSNGSRHPQKSKAGNVRVDDHLLIGENAAVVHACAETA